MLVDEGDGGLHHKIPVYNHGTMNSETIRILVTNFRSKSYKEGGSIIPLLEDTLKRIGILRSNDSSHRIRVISGCPSSTSHRK
jgi:hypothetical protein